MLKIGPHSEEGGRVTMFELFFDLVFVFSFTQVSRLMANGHSPLGVLRGLVVLGMLWGLWASFGWLSNQARADRGLVRTGLIIASILIFLLAVTIPRAFPDVGGSPTLPLILLSTYFVCRIIHAVLYYKAAGDDAGLRSQVRRTSFGPILPSAVIFVAGAIIGAPWQTWIWVAAFTIDAVVVYRSSSSRPDQATHWQVHSASYWVERYALIIILALGESVVALGVGVAQADVTPALVAAIALTVLLAFCLWWAYFERMEPASEHLMEKARGNQRTSIATDAYTYLHFPIVIGIIITALGIEVATSHLGEFAHGIGWFGAVALSGGAALYFAGTGFFWRRLAGWWPWTRMGSGVILLAVIPLVAALPALFALTAVTTLVVALLFGEELLDRWWRDRATAATGDHAVSAGSESGA
ncbi:MAG: low temperature requirement protein A [Pseudolysinimonas sp.]